LYELPKPYFFQKLKWLPTVTVPDVRLLWRTLQYCLKVEVPVIEGWLVRVSVQTVYKANSLAGVFASVHLVDSRRYRHRSGVSQAE
jgi:hypothetical protein